MAADGYEISGITVVYLIAIGFQVFLLLFLFAKRQIMRFTWVSKKTPNTPLGAGIEKSFRKDINNTLTLVNNMQWEPKLLEYYKEDSPHFYRVKTINEVQIFVSDLGQTDINSLSLRKVSLYNFLLRLSLKHSTVVNVTTLTACAKLYERARYTSEEFSIDDYREFSRRFHQIVSEFHKRVEVKSTSKDLLLSKLHKI